MKFHLFYFIHFFFFGGGGEARGGIDDYFANFARDISLDAVVMSKMSNFTICGVSSTPPPPPPHLPVYPSLSSVHRTRFFFFKF